jgi:hypothetical protein
MTVTQDGAAATADGSWMLWTVVGLVGIWVAVGAISLFAPDMVTGSEQQHLAVAALSTWVWGVVGTGAFFWAMGGLRGRAAAQPVWIGLGVATLVVWLVATVLSITLPVAETGSDPTRLPIGAMISPIAAALLTGLAGITARVFSTLPTTP